MIFIHQIFSWQFAKHYGFTEEELDFISNYDIKSRMGDELNAEIDRVLAEITEKLGGAK